jgi:hypothetical protein
MAYPHGGSRYGRRNSMIRSSTAAQYRNVLTADPAFL